MTRNTMKNELKTWIETNGVNQVLDALTIAYAEEMRESGLYKTDLDFELQTESDVALLEALKIEMNQNFKKRGAK